MDPTTTAERSWELGALDASAMETFDHGWRQLAAAGRKCPVTALEPRDHSPSTPDAQHGDMLRVRAVFLSDLHLGTRACRAESVLAFLREHPAETVFLLGDIVDFWAMGRSLQWGPGHNTVIQKLLRRARHGERVIVVPGNHDEALRTYCGHDFGGIRLEREWIHETADGRRLLLIHGDEFDQVTRYHKWVALLGDSAYNLLVRMNLWLSLARRILGIRGNWSLAGYAKRRVKKALEYLFEFEACVMKSVRSRGLDGVICGHVHWAKLREEEGLVYANCGDWVDSCTAIVEHLDGRLELIEWTQALGDASAEPEALDLPA